MSLEDRIKDLTEAIIAQTALISGAVAGKAEPAKAPAKPAAAAPAKPAAAAPAKTPGKGPGRPKKLTEESVRESLGAFLALGEDRGQKLLLNGAIRALADHFGVERLSTVDAEHYPTVIKCVNDMTAAFEAVGGGLAGCEAAAATEFPYLHEAEDAEDAEEVDDAY